MPSYALMVALLKFVENAVGIEGDFDHTITTPEAIERMDAAADRAKELYASSITPPVGFE